MSSSKIEEVGEARRSMNSICGVYGLQFTDANLLLMFLPHSLCSYPTVASDGSPILGEHIPAMFLLQKIANSYKNSDTRT